MAEFIMKDLVRKANLEQSIQIESAATSTEEIGNPVYPPARRKLSPQDLPHRAVDGARGNGYAGRPHGLPRHH